MSGTLSWQLVALSLAVFLVLALMAIVRRRERGATSVETQLEGLGSQQERAERSIREQLAMGRKEQSDGLREVRDEFGLAARALRDSLQLGLAESARLQQTQFDGFGGRLEAVAQAQERRLDELRETVNQQLSVLRAEHAAQLEAVRATVESKLQHTLEERLGASFRLVSERLEEVHRGLGEMQALASGVGDLKRVLTNVKVRGTWGEVQLGALLEQALAPDQYASNVATREGSDERVEYAVRLPGPYGHTGDFVWLPIDAKFPLEGYQRLIDAVERGDASAMELAAREVETRLRASGRGISEKYLDVPRTTDFAIMFLPVEGLYAEVLRRPGLIDTLQRDHRVLVAGPTTLWAMLNSLRLGFRTLAIQKRSSEVWTLLGSVKGDFARFGTALDAVQKKITEASSKIEEARRGSRRIERRLQDVQDQPTVDGVPETAGSAPLFDDVASTSGSK